LKKIIYITLAAGFVIAIISGKVIKKESHRFLDQYYSSMNTTNETMSLIIILDPS